MSKPRHGSYGVQGVSHKQALASLFSRTIQSQSKVAAVLRQTKTRLPDAALLKRKLHESYRLIGTDKKERPGSCVAGPENVRTTLVAAV